MNRTEKKKLVDELNQTFTQAELIVITRQSGMSVAQSSDLRALARESGCRYKVTKNTLAKLALQGTDYAHMGSHFSGPTAVLWSKDPVAPARVASQYAKANPKFEIVSGAMGSRVFDPAQIQALAKMPPMDELRGMLIGLLQAPAGKLARLIQTPAGQLAQLLHAKASQEGAA